MAECIRVVETSQKDITTTKQLSKSDINTVINFQKAITTIIQFCMEGFAEIQAIRILSTLEFNTSVDLLSSKNIDIDSSVNMLSTLDTAVTKFLGIDSSLEMNSVLDFDKETQIGLDSLINFVSKRTGNALNNIDNELLSYLDLFSLDYLDNLTIGNLDTNALSDFDGLLLNNIDSNNLDQIDFVDPDALEFVGVFMNCIKKGEVISDTNMNTTVDMLLYSYYKLNGYDGNTLNSMDGITLGNLDRILV